MEKHTTQIEWIEARVTATNKLNKYINKVVPIVLDILNNNHKLKKDGELNKKTSDLIREIIKYNPKNRIHCYIDWTEHSAYLKFKLRYESSQFNHNYVENHISLWQNKRKWNEEKGEFEIVKTYLNDIFIPLKTKTMKQVINVIKKHNNLIDKMEALKEKAVKNKEGYNNYLYI